MPGAVGAQWGSAAPGVSWTCPSGREGGCGSGPGCERGVTSELREGLCGRCPNTAATEPGRTAVTGAAPGRRWREWGKLGTIASLRAVGLLRIE